MSQTLKRRGEKMARGTILFADNDADFLNVRSEFLEDEGYTVLKASGPEEARKVLDQQRVQLAIFDIRLTDDSEGDISGLELAQEPAYRAIPKIMLTGFPDVDTVRTALRKRHVLDELPPAVDYIPKKDGPEALIQAVGDAFVHAVRLNWDLQIQWDPRERLSFLYLANLQHPDLQDDVLLQRAGELEDLFRKLFYGHRQIRIGRLLWHDDGRFCLTLAAQTPEGAIDPRILVCGEPERLAQELNRMAELAPETVEGTKLADTTETVHFGAVTYMLPDADMETIQSFREFFEGGGERRLKTVLSHLLSEMLLAWHKRGQKVEERGLMALYRQCAGLGGDGLSQTDVESRINALIQVVQAMSGVHVERRDGLMSLFFPGESPLTCPDPVTAVYRPLERYRTGVACTVSPGRLTAENMLVDAGRRAWLTDFARANQTPQWWDYVCLEAIIRFDLSHAPDLLAWLDFENRLVEPSGLHTRLSLQDITSDLRTSVNLIEQIRRHAGGRVGTDTLPYYAGLLAWVVGAMAGHKPAALYTHAERMRAAHMLLAAVKLSCRLGEAFSPSLPGGQLHMQDGHTVWMGDSRIDDLGVQELALLKCLIERAGQVVSRQTIVEEVFGEEYVADDKAQESRINTLVRRLRLKIEPNPDRARYILTLKGIGYRLDVDGKPSG